jgi:prophage regulatory protein
MAEEILLRLPQVLHRTGFSRSKLYADISSGLFVPPLQAGARLAIWPASEVSTIVAARCAAATDEEVRQVVRSLTRARARKRAELSDQIAATA